jgi:mono/diheme cytochrome c family protein
MNTARIFCPACILGCGIGAAGFVLGYVTWVQTQSAMLSDHNEGAALYAKHCASCHGVKLEGQPNWQTRKADGKLPAPPHDDSGHNGTTRTISFLKSPNSVFLRSYQVMSDMISFEHRMSDGEIQAVLDFIKSTWSEQHLQYQAERNQYQQ